MALFIRKSAIPGAGMGLFTNKPIAKDAKVIEYRGEIIGYNEYRRRARKEEDHYLFFVRQDLCIDALHTPQYKARYANDAAGLTKVKGLKNNCDYIIFGDRCFIVASKAIKAGEEILVNYTSSYWDYMRKRLKKNRLKKSIGEK